MNSIVNYNNIKYNILNNDLDKYKTKSYEIMNDIYKYKYYKYKIKFFNLRKFISDKLSPKKK